MTMTHVIMEGDAVVGTTAAGTTEGVVAMTEIGKITAAMIGMINTIGEMIEGIEMAIAIEVTEIGTETGTEIGTGIGEEAEAESETKTGTGTEIGIVIGEIGHHATEIVQEIDQGIEGIETEIMMDMDVDIKIKTLIEAEGTTGLIDTETVTESAVTTQETGIDHTNIAQNQALVLAAKMIILRTLV